MYALLALGLLAMFGLLVLVVAASSSASPDTTSPAKSGALSAGDHAGPVAGVLDEGPIRIQLDRGQGAGAPKSRGRIWTGAPFPMKDGCVASFEVNFDANFEWGCQGKVGGLAVGPGRAVGGSHSRDGASLRLMWDQGGTAKAYVYVPAGTESRQPAPLNQRRPYGVGAFEADFQKVLNTGKWHHVELGVKLNSFTDGRPNADGVMMICVDGRCRILQGVIWRSLPALAVNSFHFSVFHGGGCVATRQSAVTFRNVRVHRWQD